MKADLNRIKAALHQLAQNPNYGDSVTSNQDDTAVNNASEATCETAVSSSAPILPLQPNRKVIALPTFNSSGADSSPNTEENAENSLNTDCLAVTPSPLTLTEQLQQVVQQITNLYMEGPIVDGRLESYACESPPSNDHKAVYDANPVEYVKAASSLEQDRVTCEAPRACYRLSGVSQTGQQWSYSCPIEQLPSVSVAIARYEKLLQLLEHKQNLEMQLKEM